MEPFLPTLDLLQADPYPVYRRYRASDPVHRGLPLYPEYSETWYLFRYEHVESVLRSKAFINDRLSIDSDIKGSQVEPARGEFWGAIEMSLLMSDPPMHAGLRSMVSRFFSTTFVGNLEPFIQRAAQDLVDKLAGLDEIDLVRDFATPLPVQVIAKIMGLKVEDPSYIRKRSSAVANAMAMEVSPDYYRHASTMLQELSDELSRALQDKRRNPSDDLLSHLARPENSSGLSQQQLVSMCCQILVAGQETTVDAIGNSVLALLEHPDQLDALRTSPTLIPNAVDELLRYNSPIQVAMVRFPNKGVDIGLEQINPGACVIAMLGSANRDEARFSDPEKLNVERRFNGREVVFGQGIHRCLGAHLAQIELRIALETLLGRVKAIRSKTSGPAWRDNVVFRGLTSLPVEIVW